MNKLQSFEQLRSRMILLNTNKQLWDYCVSVTVCQSSSFFEQKAGGRNPEAIPIHAHRYPVPSDLISSPVSG